MVKDRKRGFPIMKCPICGKDVTLENKQVGVTESGTPILNQYAVCRDCKKQWNLDKQRAKRAAVKTQAPAKAQADESPVAKSATDKARPKAPAVQSPAGRTGPKAPMAKSPAEKATSDKARTKAPAEKAAVDKSVAKASPAKASPEKTAKASSARPQAEKAPAAKAQATRASSDKAAKASVAKPQAEKAPATKTPAARVSPDKAAKASTAKPQDGKASLANGASADGLAEPVTRQIPQKKVQEAMLATETADQADTVRKLSDAPAKKVPAKRPVRKADADSAKEPAKKADVSPEAKRVRKPDPAGKPARKAETDSTGRPARKADAGSTGKPARKADADSTGKPTRKADAGSDAKRAKARPARKASTDSDKAALDKKATDSKTYGNIPSEKERAKRERMVKKGYEDMLASDPKSAAAKKRAEAAKNAAKSMKGSARKGQGDDYGEEFFDDLPRFRILRVILGILSLAAGAYLGYSGFQTTSLPYYVLAGCALVSGLLLLILQMSNTLLTYLVPMMLYTAGGVFAFLERDDDAVLLYASIIYVVLGVIFLILAFSSRKDEDYGEDEYDEEDDGDDEDEDWDD